MRTIHCPKDIGLNNTFEGGDCECEQHYNNCYHCWASAIAENNQRYCERKLAEKEPKIDGDYISRQAVLDGIEELKKSPWATDKRGNGFEYLIAEALDVVAELCVKQASSVKQEPCEDCISRDMALEKMADYVSSGHADSAEDFEEYSKIICELPSVNPAQKMGHWINIDREGYDLYHWKCSKCGRTEQYLENYCPHCGARMSEVIE